jgi:predicted phosphodiesterase
VAWTKAQTEKLRSLYIQGITGKAAAARLHKTPDAVVNKAGRLGLRAPPPPAVPAQPTDRQLTKELERERKAKGRMAEKLQRMIQSHDIPVVEYLGEEYTFGAISDTHYGSLWERPDLVEKAYAIMKAAGITQVFHAGDFCEGSGMRKGHEHQVVVVGADNQVRHAHELHPKIEGMTTYFILGTHDLSFMVGAGHNIGPDLASRDDLVYLGGETATVPIKIGKTLIQLRVVHPGKGTSYALSYMPQKYIEALPGGRKPDIAILGHFHKALFMPMYRNVPSFLAGCLQSQTDWMARKMLAAEMGFWIISVKATSQGLASVKGEWVCFFEL